jgi:hypothetical protein
MKIEKKHYVIIGVVIAIIIIWYFFLRKKKTEPVAIVMPQTKPEPTTWYSQADENNPESNFVNRNLANRNLANRIVKRYIVVGKTAIIYNPVYGPAPLWGGGGPSLMYIQPYIKVSRGFNFTGAPVTVPLNTTVYPQSGQLVPITTTPVLAVEFIYNGVIKYILAKDVQEIGIGINTNAPTGSNESGFKQSCKPGEWCCEYNLGGCSKCCPTPTGTGGGPVALKSHPTCPPGTTWRSWCPCCVPDKDLLPQESNLRTFRIRNI